MPGGEEKGGENGGDAGESGKFAVLCFRNRTNPCCRRQETFGVVRNAAAVGGRLSEQYETLLPSAGGFRSSTKCCCRRRQGFGAIRK